MSFLTNIWDDVQSVAKPFIAQVPLVGGLVASRIQMSPTAAQSQVSAQLGPTATAVGYDVQSALAASKGQNTGIVGALGGGGVIVLGGLAFVIVLYLLLNHQRR